MHAPPEQVSPVVHALPSSHATVLSVLTHPVAVSQLSSVHPFPSLQFGGVPPTHALPAQVSSVVHALLSVHGAVLAWWVHPVCGSHPSSVHTLPSSQLGTDLLTQDPPAHASPVVHAFASSHGAVLAV